MKYLAPTAAICAFLLFTSCGRKAATPLPKPVRPVTVAKAGVRDVPVYLDEIGNCTAFETVMIQPQVSGPIMEIHFTDGVEVQQGRLAFHY